MEEETIEEIVRFGKISLASAGLSLLGLVISSAVGACGGEILGHRPYLKRAIPEGIGYLTHYINPDATMKAKTALQGNLDKVGALIGFFAYKPYRLYISHTRNEVKEENKK